MKKGKTVAAVLLAAGLGVFAGCSGTEEELEPLPPEREIQTLDDWESAFGEERLKDFTMRSSWHMTDNVTAEESYKEIEFMQDKDSGASLLIERKRTDAEGEVLSEMQTLSVKTEEGYIVYVKEGGAWSKTGDDCEGYLTYWVDSAPTLFEILGLGTLDVAQEMDGFTYESTRGEYTYHNFPLGTGSLVLRFADSYLETILLTGGLWDDNAYYAEVEATLSDYDATTVTIPNV